MQTTERHQRSRSFATLWPLHTAPRKPRSTSHDWKSSGRFKACDRTDVAALEVALGRLEDAMERIERAERERDLDPVPLQLNPELDPLRSDPRFRAVVDAMGLPVLTPQRHS